MTETPHIVFLLNMFPFLIDIVFLILIPPIVSRQLDLDGYRNSRIIEPIL